MKTKIHENRHINSCEFTAKLPEKVSCKNSYHHITITQHGTREEYTVESYSQKQVNWSWVNSDDKITLSFGNKKDAWDFYIQKRDEVLAALPKAFILNGVSFRDDPTEVVYRRPTGITDPKNILYGYCNLEAIKHSSRKAGNCFYISDLIYQRCDGAAITENDITFLKTFGAGQVNDVTGKAGDMTVSQHNEIDSSD